MYITANNNNNNNRISIAPYGRNFRAPVSEMTYIVSSGMLNATTQYLGLTQPFFRWICPSNVVFNNESWKMLTACFVVVVVATSVAESYAFTQVMWLPAVLAQHEDGNSDGNSERQLLV